MLSLGSSNYTAFCAVRFTSLTSGSNPVYFENVVVNDGNAFDLKTSTVMATRSGFYWLHISVGLEPGTITDVRIDGIDRYMKYA